jgi:quinol monooxygenase YgiN
VELRRYALHPGARETLIALFDRELVETQEAVGMSVLGQFRDLDDPDSFVWLRGFSDMETRRRALEAFYGGPVWKAHGRAANATMVDSDNVLLLRRLSGLELDPDSRPAPGSTGSRPGLLAVTIYPLVGSTSSAFPELFAREVEPSLREAGISVHATCATEHSPNTFPALPVREGEDVFVWTALFADEDDHARRTAELERSPVWHGRVAPSLARHLAGPAEVLRLTPTGRSRIHA